MSEAVSAAVDGDITIYDLKPEVGSFARAIREGLGLPKPAIPPRYFYDDAGSLLFDRICSTPEYYLTRTEMALLPTVADDVCALAGSGCTVIELGVGMSDKVRTLLSQLERPSLYAAADLNRMAMEEAVLKMRKHFPDLLLAGIVADFTTLQQLPEPIADIGEQHICFLPGSTIGNFPPDERHELLCSIRKLVGENGALLLGADLQKDKAVLEKAYNDAEGITARFNLNLLHRMQRELSASLNPDDFRHHAFYNEELHRIEMHLVAEKALHIELEGTVFPFAAGESIHTESSYKFNAEGFAETAMQAGFTQCRHWTDDENLFGVFWLAA